MSKVKDYRFSFREKDGGVQIILSYKDALGKWRQKSRQGFATMKEAKAAKEELREAAEKECGLTRDKALASITLEDFLPVFFSGHPTLSYKSREQYISAIHSFWTAISGTPIKKITEVNIVEIINQKKETHKISTINMRIAILRSVLNYAKDTYKIISDSPLSNIKSLKETEAIEQRPALTEEQLEHLLSALAKKNKAYYVMASISAFSGLRAGEVLGLSWADIDLEKSTITVKKQFGKTDKGKYALKRLKTKNSYRTVPISPRLIGVLNEWKATHPSQKRDLLFSPNSSTYNLYNHAVSTILPGFSTHALRHTYATNLLRHGADLKTVSALIGDTIGMVMKIYVNYTEDMRSAAADLVKKIFK